MSEWKKFKVGTPATKGFNTDCMKFESVSHTSHVTQAINIIETEEIRPSLVFDESVLNDKRILVAWLSPNHWSTGFRYGNVRFDFSFEALIEKKRFYWVESIAYKIPACRILITDVNRDAQLPIYDPTAKDGPWWHDASNDQHYFNNNYCLEFMVEAPVSLDHLKELNFVDHHKSYCSIHRYNPKQCAELGFTSWRGGAIFLSRAITSGTDLVPFKTHFVRENGKPSFYLEGAFSEFILRITRKTDYTGTVHEDSEVSKALMSAITSAYSFNHLEEACLLAAMFESEEAFINVAAIVFSTAVGLENWKALTDA